MTARAIAIGAAGLAILAAVGGAYWYRAGAALNRMS